MNTIASEKWPSCKHFNVNFPKKHYVFSGLLLKILIKEKLD